MDILVEVFLLPDDLIIICHFVPEDIRIKHDDHPVMITIESQSGPVFSLSQISINGWMPTFLRRSMRYSK